MPHCRETDYCAGRLTALNNRVSNKIGNGINNKKTSAIKLYFHYISINIRCMMQYKASFFLNVTGQFLVSFTVFLSMFFMFERFRSVEGFTYSEVLICFSTILLAFSLAEMFARGFDTFSGMVRGGDFDRILVRPRNEIVQVLGSKFELTRIGRMLQAIVMFIYGITASGIEWSFLRVLTIVFMIIGGTVIFSALFLIYAALCFFTLDGLEFMNVFTDGAREFGQYPTAIYGKKMLLFTTFVIPYSLFQYYPLLFLTGRSDNILLMFLPLAACWFMIPSFMLWKYGVRHYKSSGS